MSLQNYTLDSAYVINSPRSKIAFDRLGMDQTMIQKPLLSSYKIAISNSYIAEEAYNMKLQEVQENFDALRQEFNRIQTEGITYEEFLLAGEPSALESLVNRNDSDFSLKQQDFKIISNEEALLKRAQAEEAFREELRRQQEERIARNKQIEERHAKRLQELEIERRQKTYEEQQRQIKIQQEKREFTLRLQERNEQLQSEMRARDEVLKQQKIEQERQIQLKMHYEQMKQEQIRQENARKKAEEEKQKILQFKYEQQRIEKLEQENFKRRVQEQREREQAMRQKEQENQYRYQEIKERFQLQQREQEKLWHYKMEQAQKNLEEQKKIREEDAQRKQQEFEQKTKQAKQLQVEADQKRQEDLNQKLQITYQKIEKVQKQREENDIEILKKSVQSQLEFERKTIASEQLKRKREYSKKLQALKTQNKLKLVDEMMAKRDEIRCKNVQLSVKLDSLKSLPADERARREQEVLQSMGASLNEKVQTSRELSGNAESRNSRQSPTKSNRQQSGSAMRPQASAAASLAPQAKTAGYKDASASLQSTDDERNTNKSAKQTFITEPATLDEKHSDEPGATAAEPPNV